MARTKPEKTERRVLRRANVTPHKSLLPKMGYSGYSFPESIAELVDNSIEWRVDGEPLVVRVRVSDDEIRVEDNACGMDDRRLENAFRLAYRDEVSKGHTELSQFGVGMKTACASLGHAFRVTTTPRGLRSRYEVAWSESEWAEGEQFDWQLPVYELPGAADAAEHGTTITITDLKYRPSSRVTELKRDLGQRYATFLASGDVRIKVNTGWVKPYRAPVDEDTVEKFYIPFEGEAAWGWFGLLKEGSQRGYYGWETKRKGRMITAHDKRFGLREHPRFSKVTGEIHLDFLDVSHNKTRWIEDDRFQRVQRLLRRELGPRLERLVEGQEDEKERREVREHVQHWIGAVTSALRDRWFRQFDGPNGAGPAARGGAGAEAATVERLAREKPSPVRPEDRQAEAPPEEGAAERPKPPRVIDVGGTRLEVEHYFHPMGAHGPWFDWGVSDGGALEVFTNDEFPAFRVTEDKPFYAALHIAEAIAQLFARETPHEVDVDEVRQAILRQAADQLAAVAE